MPAVASSSRVSDPVSDPLLPVSDQFRTPSCESLRVVSYPISPPVFPHMHSATKHSTHLPDNHEALHELFTLKLALCLEEHNLPDELLINACHSACMLPVIDANSQKNKKKQKNFDMRHRPNESAHTQVQTGIRLLLSCSSRTEQKKSTATKFMIFASPGNRNKLQKMAKN